MIHRSPQPLPRLPEGPLTELVLRRARDLPSKAALVDVGSGRSLGFGALAEAVERVAAGLGARGFRKGDVLGLACPNGAEFVLAFHGALRLGGAVTPLNPVYTASEMAHQLRDAGARFLLAGGAILDKAREVAVAAGIQELFVIGEGEGATPFAALEAGSSPLPEVELDPASHPAALPYSSGTTGLPKGVLLSHRNLAVNVLQSAALGLEESDVVLGVLPLFHIFGLNVAMNTTLATGATLVLMPRFELEECLAVLERHRVTYAFLVPPILLALAKHPAVARYDLSALRCILSGAAPLGEDLAREVEARLGCRVRQGYGLTETSPVLLVAPEDGSAPRASVGRLVGGTEALVVDPEAGTVLGPGQPGELWVRGPQVMGGYLNRPEETAQALDAEGWFHTGDIAYADETGHFFVVDRLKELIKVKGMQVAPAELEALLLSHGAVADAAVIPSPDPRAGEIPKAFVVLRPGCEATAEELMAFVAERVAPHKRIRALDFTEPRHLPPPGRPRRGRVGPGKGGAAGRGGPWRKLRFHPPGATWGRGPGLAGGRQRRPAVPPAGRPGPGPPVRLRSVGQAAEVVRPRVRVVPRRGDPEVIGDAHGAPGGDDPG